ncbi:polyamine aminopropyltransferase [Plantactinospora sp. GCM10030261]|uniref:polyamine aminopropyltransferase n=1 Tax=Plantactinospora sp. GCM10030261 TaxID=3273420 RepID=UPI00361F58B8
MDARPEVFIERALPYGRQGVEIAIAVTATVYDKHSRYGHILVLDTEFFGRILVIDGILQTTVSDEFVYHEMLALAAAVRHGAPRTALIVGGGDGGALRQVLRMSTVESVVQVEIDPVVVEVSRTYLPEVSGGGYDDPRTSLVLGDGAEFVARTRDRYDLVVLDLTDPLPDSPAERLFETDFLARCRDVLTPGGVLSLQCGSLTFQPDEVATMYRRVAGLFDHVALHHAVVPGYQLTSFGFLLAADRAQPGDAALAAAFDRIAGTSGYLSPETYHSSRVLPPYLRHLTDG